MTPEKIGLEAVLKDSNFQAGMSRYMNGLDMMDRRTGTVARSVSGAMSMFGGSLVLIPFAAAGAAAGAFGLAVREVTKELQELVKRGSEIEGIRTAFMSGVGNVADIIASYREATAGMVSDTDLMKNYNNAAQLISETFAKDLPNAMIYLRKVAASTGESMDYLLDSLIRGTGRESEMILDNVKVQVDGAAAREAMAQQLGKQVDELTKGERQMALYNATMVQLRKNTADLPDVIGTTNQQWQAFQTVIRNAKDEIAMQLIPIVARLGQEILPKLAEAVITGGQQIAWFIQALDTAIGNFDIDFDIRGIGSLGTALVEVTRIMLQMVETARYLYESTKIDFEGMGASAENWKVNVISQFGDVIAAIGLWVKSMGGLVEVFSKVIAGDIPGAFANYLVISANAELAVQQIEDLMSGIGTAIENDTQAAGAFNTELLRQQAIHALNLAKIDAGADAMREQVVLAGVLSGSWQKTLADQNAAFATFLRIQAAIKGVAGGADQSGADAFQNILDSFEALMASVNNPNTEAAEQAFKTLASRIESYIDGAIAASKKLFDFSPGDITTPGANGPFENIYRAQDIAVHGEKSPWAEVLGLTPEEAKRIVEKFQQGIFDEEVQALIDMPALVDAAKLEAMAQQSRNLFIQKVAELAGTDPTVVAALLGINTPAGQEAITGQVSSLTTGTIAALTNEMPAATEAGESYIKAIIQGMQNQEAAATSAAAAIAREMIAAMRAEWAGSGDANGGSSEPPADNPPGTSAYGNPNNTYGFMRTVNPPATNPQPAAAQNTYSVNVAISGADLKSPAAVKQATTRGVLQAFREMGIS